MKQKTILIFFVVVLTCISQTTDAQERRSNFNLANYLNERDLNKNGTIEPSEVKDRDKRFMEGLKLDTSKPIDIQAVVNRVSAERKKLEEKKAEEEFNKLPRNVPGFGEPVEKSDIPGFGLPEGEESEQKVPGFELPEELIAESMVSIREQFGRRIDGQVDGIFNRYDKNKDNILNPDEIEQIRWTGKSWKTNDENGDGQISRLEMAKRIKSGAANEEDDDDDRRRGRERDRDRNDFEESSSSRNSGSSGSSSPRSRGGSSSDTQKYLSYVNSQMKQYDEDGNGKIDGEEFEKVSGILKKADANDDNIITRDEMLAQASGKKPATGGSNETGDNDRPGRVEARSKMAGRRKGADRNFGGDTSDNDSEDRIVRDLRVTGRVAPAENERVPASDQTVLNRREKADRSFERKDRNGDGHISLTEFASKLTAESIAEFKEMDKNGDGILSPSEFDD